MPLIANRPLSLASPPVFTLPEGHRRSFDTSLKRGRENSGLHLDLSLHAEQKLTFALA